MVGDKVNGPTPADRATLGPAGPPAEGGRHGDTDAGEGSCGHDTVSKSPGPGPGDQQAGSSSPPGPWHARGFQVLGS